VLHVGRSVKAAAPGSHDNALLPARRGVATSVAFSRVCGYAGCAAGWQQRARSRRSKGRAQAAASAGAAAQTIKPRESVYKTKPTILGLYDSPTNGRSRFNNAIM